MMLRAAIVGWAIGSAMKKKDLPFTGTIRACGIKQFVGHHLEGLTLGTVIENNDLASNAIISAEMTQAL